MHYHTLAFAGTPYSENGKGGMHLLQVTQTETDPVLKVYIRKPLCLACTSKRGWAKPMPVQFWQSTAKRVVYRLQDMAYCERMDLSEVGLQSLGERSLIATSEESTLHPNSQRPEDILESQKASLPHHCLCWTARSSSSHIFHTAHFGHHYG